MVVKPEKTLSTAKCFLHLRDKETQSIDISNCNQHLSYLPDPNAVLAAVLAVLLVLGPDM